MLKPGDQAPDFTLPDQDGRYVHLTELRGRPVVLYFYPKDDTPLCTREACAFRDARAEFARAGATVLGVSRDPPAAHAAFAAKHGLDFRLLSDADGAVRQAYGVGKFLGLLDGRVTFVIGPDGSVRHVFKGNFTAQRHVDEALARLGAPAPA
jgi:thioredoxin-dependent peroxiredoxin